MNGREWAGIAAKMQKRWPATELPPESLAQWGEDLAHLDAEVVAGAVEALYRDGREFAPNGGQILTKVHELASDGEDWSAAWETISRCPISLYYEQAKALEWIGERSPLGLKALKRFGVREFCNRLTKNEGTDRAQFRQIYDAIATGADREERYAGLPRASREELDGGPRQIGKVIADLEPGKEAA